MLFFFFLLSSVVLAQDSPTATVDSGALIGTTTTLSAATGPVNKFLGVPYAVSPPERFSPPSSVQQFAEPYDATETKASCIQQFNYPEASRNFTMQVFNNPGGPPPVESEDCLYLNVFAPGSPSPPGGRAVMFWIHGGGLQFGTGGLPAYDGSSFAAYEDVIVVTINYRTNAFGFPGAPQLPLAERNIGFLDQRFALEWVNRNIAQFGGDPSKVTIFGESAGGTSVDSLITAPPSQPLFRAGILESGQSSYGTNTMTLTSLSGSSAWQTLIQMLNCSGSDAEILSCARAANATTIKSIEEHAMLSFRPTGDNVTQVSNPAAVRASGQIAKVPVFLGSNAQEGRVFTFGQNNLTAFLQTTFGASPQLQAAIAQAYPITPGLTDYDVIAQIYTDLGFTCPLPLYTASTTSLSIPTWRYYFNASFPNLQTFPNAGVYHSSEIPQVFNTFPFFGVTTQQHALSRYMQGAWAGFAKNPAAGPGWNAVGTFEGVDLGALGSNGSAGVTVIDPGQVVDAKCKVFAPLYGVAASAFGG
ncbi:hypothetical protein MMC10_004673 [Thelotrema lepadinum]|nr:hypothetical protein [Thelotrema lepadinum]